MTTRDVVKPGTLWADCDPRQVGRTLRVDRITTAVFGTLDGQHGGEVPYAVCTVATARGGKPVRSGRRVTIRLSRFRPTSNGYRLVSEQLALAGVDEKPAPTGWRVDVPMVAGRAGERRPWTENDHVTHPVRARYAKTIRSAVWQALGELWIPAQDHVTVCLHYRPGDNRRRDTDNLTTSAKPSFDAVVDAGIVKDDTPEWMTKLMPVIHGGRERRALWLEITPGRPS
ncbi:MAG TPA: hypothetical protein VFQ42_04315 [Mycobacterium sp.]|nr:hypothetical protein [Mycobacterium sp.]